MENTGKQSTEATADKGQEKVAAEASLMFTAYNIRRAIRLAGGVQNLIRRMTEALERMKSEGRSLPI